MLLNIKENVYTNAGRKAGSVQSSATCGEMYFFRVWDNWHFLPVVGMCARLMSLSTGCLVGAS
jgi:hypothetical protein